MQKENKQRGLWLKRGKKAAYGVVGLSVVLQPVVFAAGNAFGQLRDMSSGGGDTENILQAPDPMDAGLRLSMKNSVPKQLQDQAVALCLLAREVISKPDEAGARFSADPKAFLAGMGITGTVLDLNSREVKIVLALGDPEVRDAAMRGDTRRYLRLLEDRGILGYTGPDTAQMVDKGATPPPARCVTPVVAVAEIVAVTMAVAEAAAAVHAIMYFWTEGASADRNVLDGMEGKVTSLLWGPSAAKDMLNSYISEKSEEWADAIADLPSVKAKNLSKAEIKKLLEQHMAEELGK
jgi:hypothetical protein